MIPVEIRVDIKTGSVEIDYEFEPQPTPVEFAFLRDLFVRSRVQSRRHSLTTSRLPTL